MAQARAPPNWEPGSWRKPAGHRIARAPPNWEPGSWLKPARHPIGSLGVGASPRATELHARHPIGSLGVAATPRAAHLGAWELAQARAPPNCGKLLAQFPWASIFDSKPLFESGQALRPSGPDAALSIFSGLGAPAGTALSTYSRSDSGLPFDLAMTSDAVLSSPTSSDVVARVGTCLNLLMLTKSDV